MSRAQPVKVALLILTLGALLTGAVAGAAKMWAEAGVDIGVFGWSVIAVGAVVTVALGAGLMWLSFHSARAGYDAQAHEASDRITALRSDSPDEGQRH
jgi:hypothetical protein